MKIKIYKQAIVPIFLLILLLFSEFLYMKIDFLHYLDEGIASFFAVYIVLSLKKIKTLSKRIKRIIYGIVIIFLLGIVSTIINKIQIQIWPIFLDFLATFKLFIVLVGFYMMLNKEIAKNIMDFFEKPAKLFLIIGFIFGILSLFWDLGMRGEKRFGIWCFHFVFGQAHIYSMLIIFASLIIVGTNGLKLRYIILAIIQMFLTTKGPSIIWAISILAIIYYMNYNKKIHLSLLIVLAGIILFFGQYQIQTYLQNETSPRAYLYKYGIITANTYFPLGSGFATYGSDMAAKYYSTLYSQYGFNSLYGMSKYNPAFLNDNYWPLIMGQFGWIGLATYIFILYNFFMILQNLQIKGAYKAFVFSAFLYTMIHSIGSSTFTASCTIILYIGIILLLVSGKEEKSGE